MSSTTKADARIWQMPVEPLSYDRGPLTLQEKRALALLIQISGRTQGEVQEAKKTISRLQTPLLDVMALRMQSKDSCRKLLWLLYRELYQRGTSCWEWSETEWKDIICPTNQAYFKKYYTFGGRPSLMDMAYLLGGITDLRDVDLRKDSVRSAWAIFGKDLIEQAVHGITPVLENQGYAKSDAAREGLRRVLCILFFLNRSPYLEDLSWEFLQSVNQGPYELRSSHHFSKVCIALERLGFISQPVKLKVHAGIDDIDATGVSEEWAKWCRAWINRYPKAAECFRSYYTSALSVGRWLADRHPDVVAPEQWDEDLALEYVHYVCTDAKVGDYASPAGVRRLTLSKQLGRPLAPRTMNDKLSAMSRMFTDWQTRPHSINGAPARKIDLPFLPHETFLMPPSIRRLIQPDPRDIDEIIWCKLTYAAATLTEEDIAHSLYPLVYFRAAALLWITSARRPNEIIRLPLGCIRRDWDPEMLNEYGAPLSPDAQLCYLHVPSNKTKGRFFIPIPKYAADALEAWERERPSQQPQLLDQKDHAYVDFLFCFRGKRMGLQFFNHTLIPLLCKRAGVPERDARGTITGHRARSTIATMLRRNGLSLDDISQFLGHASPTMVRAYARTDPFRFGREVTKANDLMRIVEGIIDTRAAKAGQPNVFFFLGRGADGKPHFCGNPAWEKCAHRLACLKCSMYVGADQASRLAERLEARDELLKFQTQVEMIPQEKAAIDGDIEALTALIEAETDTPPPALPNEQFRFNASPPEAGASASSCNLQEDLLALSRELTTLHRDLSAAEKRSDGRNAHVRSLKKRITEVTERMAQLDQLTVLTTPTLGKQSEPEPAQKM